MTQASKLLPHAARAELAKAAETPNTQKDPLAKLKAIDRTIARIRAQYPTYFRAEDADKNGRS